MTLILSMVLAHLIADFYLQTDEMAKNKDKLKYMCKHLSEHVLLLLLVLTINYFCNPLHNNILNNIIWPIIILAVTHFLIDTCKYKIDQGKSKYKLKQGIAYLWDQILHLIVIVFIYLLFFTKDILSSVNHGLQLLGIIEGKIPTITIINLIFFLIIMGIMVTRFSNYLIKSFIEEPNFQNINESKLFIETEFEKTESESKELKTRLRQEINYIPKSNSQDIPRGGFIGYLERLLIIILMMFGAYQGIAFIIAAKSFARFKQLDNREWAEYFLSGTLLSIILGIVFGLIIVRVSQFNIVI